VSRPPELRVTFAPDDEGMVIDLFAGGGGASTGIAEALKREPDIAINHSPAAIAVHRANHPRTRHFIEDVWKVKPRDVCGNRRVLAIWASPDCTHHANAKGGKPVSSKRRSLAYAVVRWAREVRPEYIFLENVKEFEGWGPLDATGRPDKAKKGRSFRAWVSKIRALGYHIEWRTLVAADFGAHTTRERLYIVASLNGSIAWPVPTHGPGRAQPWRTAAEVIDWDDLGTSIFTRKKPLVAASLRRIVAGIQREVVNNPEPFLVKYYGTGTSARVRDPLDTITTHDRFGVVTPILMPVIVRHNGGTNGHQAAPRKATSPLGAVTTRDQHSLATAFLVKLYGTSTCASALKPMPTVTTGGGRGGGHIAAVQVLLTKYGAAPAKQRDLFGLDLPGVVMVNGEPYAIVDILFRMLRPRELFGAQGFPSTYVIAPDLDGKPLGAGAQTELAGNSVCPAMARALVSANIREAA